VPFRRRRGSETSYTADVTTRVKICGVTSLEDAELAAGAGAWAIGMVFHPDSPRRCELDVAAEIGTALKRRVEVAGVFVNALLDEVVAVSDAAGLSMVQLHGDEGPAYCAEVRRRTGVRVIKAARVRNASTVRSLSVYRTDYHMLDAHVHGIPGGTGERFDWSLAREHPGRPPLILSGGLRAENVAEGIELVRPFAVDVSSGVEAAPGRKDPQELRRFIEAAHAPARV
jgi:phosphoribosylanthranilate isomerase